MQAEAKAQDFSLRQMRRFLAHMNARAWPVLPRLTGMSWRRARARAHAFGHPRVTQAIEAYEAGVIADFRDLKIVTAAIAPTNDHRRYEASLRLFDPGLALPEGRGRAGFVGYGVGGGSLNVYRTIGKACFEKIYRRDSAHFSRMSFAHATILPRLRALHTPALLETTLGGRLAMARFRLLPSGPARHFDLESAAAIVQSLAALDLSDITLPPALRRFPGSGFRGWQMTLFARIRRDHAASAEAHIARLQHLQEQIASRPGVFAHGDLNRTNFTADGHVIDWDTAGIYPYGYDAAYAALRAGPFSDIAQLEAISGRYFERPGTAEEDRAAFLFFFLHFMQERRHQRANEALFGPLLDRLGDIAP